MSAAPVAESNVKNHASPIKSAFIKIKKYLETNGKERLGVSFHLFLLLLTLVLLVTFINYISDTHPQQL